MFKTKKVLALFTVFFSLCAAACASESIISSVTISQPADLNGAYQLTVKSDKPVEFKEKAQSERSIYFDLKNATSVDNLDTIYDNVSGVDAVIVQQLENNKVRIYVNGENTNNTKLVFQTTQKTTSDGKNQIVINRPIREYRPTNDINEFSAENMDWDENSFNPGHLLSSFFGLFGEKSDMTLVICLILLVGSVVISKKIFAKVKLQEEPLIGLSGAYKGDNNILDINIPQKRELPPLKSMADASKFVTNTYKKTTPVQKNAIQQNYALGAYKNAQKNPYTTNDTVKKPQPQSSANLYQRRIQKPASKYVSQPQGKVAPPAKKQGASVENIKFLESVTKIYEQSGRKDLAQGLKAGINKRKSAV